MRVFESFCISMLLIAVLLGCDSARLVVSECDSNDDCSGGMLCIDGFCRPLPPADLDLADRESSDGDEDPPEEGEIEQDDGDSDETDSEEPDGDPIIHTDGDSLEDGDTDPDLEPEVEPEPEYEIEYDIPQGNACEDAIALEINVPMRTSSFGATDDFDPGEACTGTPLAGSDMVFRIELQPDTGVLVSILPLGNNYNPAIYLLQDCDPANLQCIRAADDGRAGEIDSFRYYSETGGTYFIVVDSVFGQGNPGGWGDFQISAMLEPNMDACEPCSPEQAESCGANAGCVVNLGPEGPIEYACADLCNIDEDCPQGFVCDTRLLADDRTAEVCVPKYGQGNLHTYGSCGALRDMGTPCIPGVIRDNDEACGADEGGTVIDDAVCFFFFELTDLVSYCTIYCVDDTECPEGYFCYDVPLSQDFVCKLR